MASVTFPTTVGGDGSTVSDDSNPSTGLANGGHRTRFVPALSQMVAIAGNTVTKATEAAASAASALNAPGTQATSTSSMSIGSGTKSLTLAQTGKAFAVGQYVQIVNSAAPANYMIGAITAFNSGTGAMTVSVPSTDAVGGSGTYTTWAISASSPPQTGGARLLATLTPTNGSTQVSSTSLPVSRQFDVVVVGVGATLDGVFIEISSNNGSGYTSPMRFDVTNAGGNGGVASVYAAEGTGDKLILSERSGGAFSGSVPGNAPVNAIRITPNGGATFTGTGAIYIYGIN